MSAAVDTLVLGGAARVNLLPPAEVERRARVRLGRRWIGALMGTAVVVVLIIAAAVAYSVVGSARLASEQARTQQLVAETQSYQSVATAVATRTELTQFRADALGYDIRWGAVFDTISAHLTPGASVTGFSLTAGAQPQAGTTAQRGLGGSLTVSVANPADAASLARALRGVSGVLAADAGDVTSSTTAGTQAAPTYDVTIDVVFDQSVYSGQFSQEGK